MKATLVATAKNEGPYILEWVAHHRLIGFTDILFFQNDSDDYTHQTLKALHNLGVVKYFYNRAQQGKHQVRAYKRASNQAALKNADWALALDLDEFLTIHVGQGKLADLVEASPDCDQLVVNWKLFGNDGHGMLTDELVTERFTSAEPVDLVQSSYSGFKSLFRPSSFGRPGIHNPRDIKKPEDAIRRVNGSGLTDAQFQLKNWRSTDPKKRSLAQVNHYAVKDTATYVVKNARGSAHQASRDLNTRYWELNNFNTQQDMSMVRRSGAVRDEMHRLNDRSNDRLFSMRNKALEKHRARFNRLMEEACNVELYHKCSSITK